MIPPPLMLPPPHQRHRNSLVAFLAPASSFSKSVSCLTSLLSAVTPSTSLSSSCADMRLRLLHTIHLHQFHTQNRSCETPGQIKGTSLGIYAEKSSCISINCLPNLCQGWRWVISVGGGAGCGSANGSLVGFLVGNAEVI
jgi:hypothetical protein